MLSFPVTVCCSVCRFYHTIGNLGFRGSRNDAAECHFVNLGWDSRRPGAHLVRTPLPLRLIPLLCYPTPSPCYPTPLPCSLTPSLCSPTPLPCSPTPLPCSLSGRVTHFINSIAHHGQVLLVHRTVWTVARGDNELLCRLPQPLCPSDSLDSGEK